MPVIWTSWGVVIYYSGRCTPGCPTTARKAPPNVDTQAAHNIKEGLNYGTTQTSRPRNNRAQRKKAKPDEKEHYKNSAHQSTN